MKNLILILSSLILFSCGSKKVHTIETKTERIEREVFTSKCESIQGGYNECKLPQAADRIATLIKNGNVACKEDTDYYLINSFTLAVDNNCKATFIIYTLK